MFAGEVRPQRLGDATYRRTFDPCGRGFDHRRRRGGRDEDECAEDGRCRRVKARQAANGRGDQGLLDAAGTATLAARSSGKPVLQVGGVDWSDAADDCQVEYERHK